LKFKAAVFYFQLREGDSKAPVNNVTPDTAKVCPAPFARQAWVKFQHSRLLK